MNETELLTLINSYNAPLTLLLFIYIFFKVHKLEIALNRLDGKLCTILTILNNLNERKKE